MGRPIEVEKVSNPSQDLIDKVHADFIKALIDMFEEEKHRYIKDYKNVKIEIE